MNRRMILGNIVGNRLALASSLSLLAAVMTLGCSTDATWIDTFTGSLRDGPSGDSEEPSACSPGPNPGSPGDINVDLTVTFQLIRGFGGINVPGWIADLTPEQVDTAFGNGPGQIGMSLLRVRVPYDPEQFALEVPTAVHAVELGATVIASPWTPPAALKSSGDIVGGSLLVDSYGAYADHLLSFRDFMRDSGVPLYAISVQNEPDINVTH